MTVSFDERIRRRRHMERLRLAFLTSTRAPRFEGLRSLLRSCPLIGRLAVAPPALTATRGRRRFCAPKTAHAAAFFPVPD